MTSETKHQYIAKALADVKKHRAYLYDGSWQPRERKATKTSIAAEATHRRKFEKRIAGIARATAGSV